MISPFIRTLYVSRIAPETAAKLPEAMRDILRRSHRNNERDAITGFLWSNGETFTQVFEGPGPKVDDLLARLLIDPRHQDMRLRYYEPAFERLFPRWTMCGLSLSDVDAAVLAPADITPDLYAIEPGAIIAMLSRIAEAYGERLDAAHAEVVAGEA